MCKDVFVDGYKLPNVVENHYFFFTQIEELKPYIIEFDEDGVIKAKEYLVN